MKAALAALLFVGVANAAPVEVIAEAVSGDTRVALTRVPGPCEGDARLVIYKQGVKTLSGCYKPVQAGPQTLILINWLDGDRDTIPLEAFKAPSGT